MADSIRQPLAVYEFEESLASEPGTSGETLTLDFGGYDASGKLGFGLHGTASAAIDASDALIDGDFSVAFWIFYSPDDSWVEQHISNLELNRGPGETAGSMFFLIGESGGLTAIFLGDDYYQKTIAGEGEFGWYHVAYISHSGYK